MAKKMMMSEDEMDSMHEGKLPGLKDFKLGTNREGGRGGSVDVAGERADRPKRGGFFGSTDGSNTQTQNHPVVKPNTKPTL